jgi:hypothetical protein
MTIKQQGGIFGRNPTFNEVDVQTNVSFSENAKALFGNSSDLAVYHNGSDSIIEDTGSGNLYIQGTHVYIKDASGNNFARFYDNGTGGQIRLYHDASKVFETNSYGISITGNVAVTSGNGIDFSATSGTGTSELLDDYEEGTWTPTDQSGGSLSFSDADGVYTKIGDLVFAAFAIDYPTTSDTNGIIIGGLPFTVDVKNLSGGTQYGGIVGFTNSLDFAKAALGPLDASSTFGVYAQGTTGYVQNSSLSGKIVRGSVIYKT